MYYRKLAMYLQNNILPTAFKIFLYENYYTNLNAYYTYPLVWDL